MTDDRARLAGALDIVTDGQGAGTLRRLAYPLYVAVILLATYGFTVAQAVFVASNPGWIRAHLLTPGAVALGAALLAIAAGLIWRGSRRRGAVVPPIAWTDQVLTSPIDRATALQPWWHLTLAASVSGGAVVGVLLGASLWVSTVTGGLAVPVAAAVGAVVGVVPALASLWGQAGQLRPAPPAQVLRRLRIEDLRAQASTSDQLLGSLLAGDVRGSQLELSQPSSRGRHLTLRSGGPVVTVVRRDILGQRRDPFAFWRGTILAALGACGTAWTVIEPATPPILAGLGVLLVYAGASAWSEGLRMCADQFGAPALLGLSPRRRAVAHSILPGAAVLVAWVLACGLIVLTSGSPDSGSLESGSGSGSWWSSAGLLLGSGAYVTAAAMATVWLAAFRPPADMSVFMPGSGPTMMLLRLCTPGLVAFVAGTLLPGAIRDQALTWPAVVLAGALAWALSRGTTAATRRPD